MFEKEFETNQRQVMNFFLQWKQKQNDFSLYHGCWTYAREKKLVNSLLSVNYHYYYYMVYFYFWQKFEWKKECFKELSFMITTKKYHYHTILLNMKCYEFSCKYLYVLL